MTSSKARSPGSVAGEPGPGGWIVSQRFDLALVLIPLGLALLSLPSLGEAATAIPLWAFLFLIVAFDVAHVWSTIYISYLDPDTMRRRRWLLLLPLPLSFLVAFRLHLHSPSLYWTLLAYVAIYHFIKQQYGFIALYKARAGERSSFDYNLDRWTLWTGALGPVLIWHASPSRNFDWFNAGESFIARIDPVFRADIVVLMGVVGALYVGRQAQLWLSKGQFNAGKNLWMVASWMSWSVGLSVSHHPLVSAAFINLMHGIPFIALVWYRCQRKYETKAEGGSRLIRWLVIKRRWLLFYLLVLAPALLEETLWDGLVWQVHLPELSDLALPRLSSWWLSFWVALLSVPQIVHYFLDAWLWKLDGSNPELNAAVFPER